LAISIQRLMPGTGSQLRSASISGAWVISQRLIPTGEQSELQTRIAATEKRFVARADEKLTAFVELESTIGNQNVAQAL
jgi:hypothetical protein